MYENLIKLKCKNIFHIIYFAIKELDIIKVNKVLYCRCVSLPMFFEDLKNR
jgi:hypothetical protein